MKGAGLHTIHTVNDMHSSGQSRLRITPERLAAPTWNDLLRQPGTTREDELPCSSRVTSGVTLWW
jgi:hypothetical protein